MLKINSEIIELTAQIAWEWTQVESVCPIKWGMQAIVTLIEGTLAFPVQMIWLVGILRDTYEEFSQLLIFFHGED